MFSVVISGRWAKRGCHLFVFLSPKSATTDLGFYNQGNEFLCRWIFLPLCGNVGNVLKISQLLEIRAVPPHPLAAMPYTCLSFSGGNDHLVKVWDYNEGEVTHVGVGHSGNITRIRISPGNQYIVSVSADGAILRWKYPFAS